MTNGPKPAPRGKAAGRSSPNRCYVNPFVRGTPTPAGLRFSSTVVRGIEIAVFVAKRDTVASVAATVVVASAGAGERRQRQSGPRRRPATPHLRPQPATIRPICDRRPFRLNLAKMVILAVFG